MRSRNRITLYQTLLKIINKYHAANEALWLPLLLTALVAADIAFIVAILHVD